MCLSHSDGRAPTLENTRRMINMGFKTDIEIAQECEMLPITEIAKTAGVDEKYLEQYGKYKAKVDYNILKEVQRPDGKLILVTAIKNLWMMIYSCFVCTWHLPAH